METFIIAYVGKEFIPQHDILPVSGVYGNCRVIIKHGYSNQLRGGEVVRDFDHLVTNSDYIYPEIPPHRTTHLRRMDKFVQQLLINNTLAGFVDFLPIKTWSPPLTPSDDTQPYLIKATTGARGIGQMLVKATETRTLHATISDVYRLSDNGGSLEHAKSWVESNLESVQLVAGNENYEGESLRKLIDSDDNRKIVQELLTDIIAEYRILTDCKGKIHYIQRREKIVAVEKSSAFNEYHIATGRNGGDMVDTLGPEIDKAIAALNQPMSSIDIAIRPGGFSILEFSNEYGYEGVPIKVIQKLYNDFIINILHQHGVLP